LFQARVAEAEANLQRARAERDKAQVAVAESRRHLERLNDLKTRMLVSESELDAGAFALQSAEVQLRVTDAQVQQNAAALNYARLNLDYTTIRAPIDGVVISRDVDVGQTVAASLQAPTLFTIARDLRQMQIETDVDEAYIGQVAERQPVSFTVFAYPERSFAGTVAQVRLQPRVEAGVVKYNCIIHVDNADLALKPGMTATVGIEVARRADVLKVPNAALRFVPPLPSDSLKALQRGVAPGATVVWTPKDGVLAPLRVQVGIVGESETEIRGEAVAEGLAIAVPLTLERSANRRPRGFSLF
jgi:HlyD family secretion protein